MRDLRLREIVPFQSVREVQLEAFILPHAVSKLLEDVGDLQVPDRIGRHHELEGVEIPEDVIAYERLEAALAVLRCVLLCSEVDCSGRKGLRSCGGIENGDRSRRESVGFSKLLFLGMVERSGAVGNNRIWRV